MGARAMSSMTEDTRAPDWGSIAARLRGVALALTASPDEAEDLTQQTIARLLAKRPEKADHLGYARRTMLRLWLDRQRAWRRRARRLALAARERATWAPARDGVDEAERAAAVRRAVDALPARQRAAIVLRIVEGLDYAAIAETLGCSVESVRANLHLARAAARRRLKEHAP